jgi:nitroreductase
MIPNPFRTDRKPDHPIEAIFLNRWSPRAMTGEAVTPAELNSILEAARWAPSTNNEQEWRFLYGHKDSPVWGLFFDLLDEGNKIWCRNAAVLMLICSHKVFARNGKPNPVHSFDSGSAFQSAALQGTSMGLVVHGMLGFDHEKARQVMRVPDDYDVEAMVAVGRPGDPDLLPPKLREREKPSGRKPIGEFSWEGPFKS